MFRLSCNKQISVPLKIAHFDGGVNFVYFTLTSMGGVLLYNYQQSHLCKQYQI